LTPLHKGTYYCNSRTHTHIAKDNTTLRPQRIVESTHAIRRTHRRTGAPTTSGATVQYSSLMNSESAATRPSPHTPKEVPHNRQRNVVQRCHEQHSRSRNYRTPLLLIRPPAAATSTKGNAKQRRHTMSSMHKLSKLPGNQPQDRILQPFVLIILPQNLLTKSHLQQESISPKGFLA